jgi:oxygen-independent coproporphyrinogen III oxidase
MSATLSELLEGGEYLSYAYAYPHKTAYRALSPPVPLKELWADEDRSALFLYLHVPFCEQRCGFCNLFTQVQPGAELEARYVAALEEQGRLIADVLSPSSFARVAIGGGTPTHLSAPLLDRALGVARHLGAIAVPTSIEVSPATLDEEKVAVVRAHGVTRVSMGVQSVIPSETSAVQRRQRPEDVERTLGWLAAAVPVRNVDLIYGLPGQTPESLCASIDRVIELGANELYLYPLYVRELTVLGRRPRWNDERLVLYRAGRAHLQALGWRQLSMRMFTAPDRCEQTGPTYRCQDDGMVGLGPGARSYTRQLHYATPFAVGQSAVRARIEEWLAQSGKDHAFARHGYRLDDGEQRRRYVLLSLLDRGLERTEYLARFGADVLEHFPELMEVVETGLGTLDAKALRLTDLGVERADVLGHWLQSEDVRRARGSWEAA